MTSPAGRINLRSPTTAQDTGDIDWSNQWLRLEYSVTGTTQTLDIFAGANLHGATPSETLTGAVTNGSGFNTVRVGSAISDSLTMFIDEFAIDDANMPARLDDPTPPEEGDFNYVWDGSSLLAADPYFWNGTTLEPLDAYVWDGTQLT